MEELHAAIAAYLRAHRRQIDAPNAHEAAILSLWRARWDGPHCRYCGKPITDGDGLMPLAALLAARVCLDHAGVC